MDRSNVLTLVSVTYTTDALRSHVAGYAGSVAGQSGRHLLHL